MTLYNGWTDDRTDKQYCEDYGYCPNCERQNYAGRERMRGDLCPACNETVLERSKE